MFSRIASRRLFSTAARRLQETAPKAVPKPTPVAPKPSLVKKTGKFLWRATWVSTLLATSYVAYQIYDEANPGPQQPQSKTLPNGAPKKTVVILGSGWGAVTLLKNIDSTLYNVVVVSPRNYFLFTPLLPSAPTGTVDLRSIIEPVRSIVRRSPGEIIYYEAEATDVDPKKKTVTIKGNSEVTDDISYDYLVVAVGAKPNTFGIPGVYENASFLKEIPDSQEVRSKILANIEKAAHLSPEDPERKRLLSFVVVGGGPTGVEFAGELQDFVDQDLRKWYPSVAPEVRVSLVEALPNILNMFNPKLIKYAETTFEEENIALRLKTMVKKVDDKVITAAIKHDDGSMKVEEIPYGVLVWATGNGARDVTVKLASKLDGQTFANRGLLFDEQYLKVVGDDSIFAIGDCTLSRKLAPTAQVAHQEAIYLSKLLKNLAKIDAAKYELAQTTDAENKAKLLTKIDKLANFAPFEYNHMGALAYIGADKAIADLSWGNWTKLSLAGRATFLFWKASYTSMNLSFRSRCLVVLDWIKVGIFGRDSSKEA